MKVFISFSHKDHSLVHEFSSQLLSSGIKPVIAQEKSTPGKQLSAKVKKMIHETDCFVVLLTKDGTESEWVQQEIGVAQALNKEIIPLIVKGVELPGMLDSGIEYYRFTKTKPTHHFIVVSNYLEEYAKEKGISLGAKVKAKVHDEYFQVIHLPNAILCPTCSKIENHVLLCKLCGDYLCTECGDDTINLDKHGA